MLAALFALLPLLPLITALETAGNENYARDSRRLLRRSIAKRSSYAPAFQPESITFEVGSKQYLSATGVEFKSYSLNPSFGLESYSGKTLLVTVIPVSGAVTCDALGKKVEEYTRKDDVWDPVSARCALKRSGLTHHSVIHASRCLDWYKLPRQGGGSRLRQRLGWIPHC